MERSSDPETIHNLTPAERAAWDKEHRRTFLDGGPEELRWLRVKMFDQREKSRNVILRRVQASRALDRQKSNPESPADRVRELEEQLRQAISDQEMARSEANALQEQNAQALRDIEARSVPIKFQEEALVILAERDRLVASILREADAGRLGGLAGRQFGILSQLDQARASRDSPRIGELEDDLSRAKAEMAVAEAHQDQVVERVKAVQEEYRIKLASLGDS